MLPFGQFQSLALPGESYTLAFTPGLLDVYKSKITSTELQNVLRNDGKYVDLDGDGFWWIPSGKFFYSKDENNELVEAQAHFFLPRRFRDPFGQTATVTYDTNDLLMEKNCDALGNEVIAENDYRVLQPELITDPNGNQSQVAFDALGLVAGTAIMGKNGEGDSLENFKADLTQSERENFFETPRSLNPNHAAELLGNATTRIIYDVDCYFRTGDPNQPPYAATLARERHVSDLQQDEISPIQVNFSYSDGFGREIQKKIQAEPGSVDDVYADPRWVGSGWRIFNNKGKPVKQYEPFFDDTHRFRFGKQVGVSPTL
ncbi:MAG: toxin, partial [Gammaproteobacteria bacterium]|nr:toxin [Gammaproteobacteria bacterium]